LSNCEAKAVEAWNRRASRPAPTVEPVANRLMAVCERLANTPMEMSLGDWGECSVVMREAASTISALVAERDEARERTNAAIEDYNDSLAALTAALAVAPKPRVRKLEWHEVTTARSAEDPTQEPTGDYEALSPVGTYYVQMYFGTDSYGWNVMLDHNDVADKDDPEDAKAAAQADYERRILSALEDQS
jgi:hypothetical protein